jgi:hypothetical protein
MLAMPLRPLSNLMLMIVVLARSAAAADCGAAEPDSLQISWNTPCERGNWLFEPGIGCRIWDWHPAPGDLATWTGACNAGLLVGRGVLQWFEHGLPIDRFEGIFVAGKRQGPGRYRWNSDDWFIGYYEDDLPNGPGTASVGGKTFSGRWRAGCLTQSASTVAIGVPRNSCADHVLQLTTQP